MLLKIKKPWRGSGNMCSEDKYNVLQNGLEGNKVPHVSDTCI